ncbi:MAG: hypothetical protein LUE10_07875 [Alistipes sp.]|nr:hypothetical protein [Alistipes sp.]
MKNKLLLILAVIAAALFSTSCTSVSRTGTSVPWAYSEVHPNRIKAELEFDTDKKASGQARVGYLFGMKISGGKKYAENVASTDRSIFGRRGNMIKSMAMYDAMHNTDYDIIVNPQYETTHRKILFGLYKQYDVKVTGYGAKITNLTQESESSVYLSNH